MGAEGEKQEHSHMRYHATLPSFSVEPQKLVRSFCPACQDLMVAALQSQFVDNELVRHWWSCESCGHEFRTTVRMPALPVEACRHAVA